MSDITPITREEMYYNEILGNDEDISPITRTEIWLDKIAKNTTSSEPEATSEGTYTDTIDGSLFIKSIYGMSVQDGTPTPSDPVLIEDSLGNFTVTDSDETNTQTITTGITLRAIEVTSSDAYNLEYDGNYYIADSIDWVDGTGYVLTQRIISKEVDFSDWAYSSTEVEHQMYISINNFFGGGIVKPSNINTTASYLMCNYVESVTRSDIISSGLQGVTATTVNILFQIDDFTSATDYTDWATGKTIILNAILSTPTTSTLTTAQTTALLGLVTYEDSTTITGISDPACLVEVEYGSSKLVNQVIKNKIDIALLKLEE